MSDETTTDNNEQVEYTFQVSDVPIKIEDDENAAQSSSASSDSGNPVEVYRAVANIEEEKKEKLHKRKMEELDKKSEIQYGVRKSGERTVVALAFFSFSAYYLIAHWCNCFRDWVVIGMIGALSLFYFNYDLLKFLRRFP